MDIPVKVTAGPHKVGVTFIARTFAESDEVLHSFRPARGRGSHSAESAAWRSRDRSTRPASARRRAVRACSSAGRRARATSCRVRRRSSRQLRARRTVVRSPMPISRRRSAFYGAARALGDFDTAIRDALPTILASPKFLYRAERSPAGLAPGSVHAIGDVELASRLSFFLIGRAPDDELLAVAERGTLDDTERARGAGAAAAGRPAIGIARRATSRSSG